MDNLEFLTDDDKNDISYKACVGGQTLVGAAVGGFALGFGSIAGGLVGLASGLMTCGYLAKPIRQKIFAQHARLSDFEIDKTLAAIKKMHPQLDKKQALQALAAVRQSKSNKA